MSVRFRHFATVAISVIVSTLASTILFVVLGVQLPAVVTSALYGGQALQDSAAHGDAILLMTVPAVGFVSVLLLPFLTKHFYRKLSE